MCQGFHIEKKKEGHSEEIVSDYSVVNNVSIVFKRICILCSYFGCESLNSTKLLSEGYKCIEYWQPFDSGSV